MNAPWSFLYIKRSVMRMEENALKSEGRTGSIRFLRQLNKYEFAVEIQVMREGLNNNRWDYRNLREHYLSFLGQPILIAYVGKKIGDGHNMRQVRLPDGSVEYTFTDGTAERIIGTISENEEDLRLEEINRNLWMFAKGRIFAFYARETVEKIRATGAMDVSAETEIFSAEQAEDGVEIFNNWAGLGVTILGDDVPPAIPGARIKAMSVSDDVRGMNLRAASLRQKEDESSGNNDAKGVKAKMNKRDIARLQAMFTGYTVLTTSEDGMKVCLMSNEDGTPSGYTFTGEADKGGIVPERIYPVTATLSYRIGEEDVPVELDKITDELSAKLVTANAENKQMTAKIAELEEKVRDMESKETARRISDAKKAVMNRLDILNRNRDERCAYSKELADEVCAKCESGCFNECVNEKGEWCGDETAVMQLEALCVRAQEKMDEQTAEKKKNTVSWNAVESIKHGIENDESNDANALLDWLDQQ